MERPSRFPGRVRAGSIAALVVACASMVPVAAASAAGRGGPACTFDPGTHVVTVPQSVVINIDRDGTNVTVNDTVCGTVFTVDQINIDLEDHSSTNVDINMTHGKFQPGFTDEPGGQDEIEFDIFDLGIGDILFVSGGSASDIITVGDRDFSGNPGAGVELNGESEVFVPDEDVRIHGTEMEPFLLGGGGGDFLSGQGTGQAGSVPYTGPLFFADGPGADQVLGGNGNDDFSPEDTKDEADSYQGFGGRDIMAYYQRTSDIRVTLDNNGDDGSDCVPGPMCEGDNVHSDVEFIQTGSGNDGLFGLAGNQLLDAGGGSNLIQGGPGNDVMIGHDGSTTFRGGKGKDEVVFSVFQPVVVTIDGNKNDGVSGGDDVGLDVEMVHGGTGNDQITGNAKANTLFGGFGADVLFGLGGNDVLDGGIQPLFFLQQGTQDGDDTFVGGPGADTVIERHPGGMELSIDGVANDRVPANPQQQGTDNIHTDVENVTAVGAGRDHITGNAAKNRLKGGANDDELEGLGGDDTLVGGPGSDRLTGGPGLDTASFSDAAAAIKASLALESAFGEGADDLIGLERITGSKFGDELTGSGGPNVLTGGAGPDELDGLAGNDRLVGGPGNDDLDGGPDTDTCLQGAGSGPLAHCEQ
jgi:Ca2+-binding RTX toxin-like protein